MQVVKEQIGTKGPRVTTQLSLAGRYVVLMPTESVIRVSKRITSWAEKRRLRRVAQGVKPEGYGLIIRTVAENADEVVVMYASKIMETASVDRLFAAPLHPYTHGLLRSLPRLGADDDRLQVIPGSVPDPLHFPAGCKFHPRCPHCSAEPDAPCRTKEPPLEEIQPGHFVACWKARELMEKTK